MVYLSLRRKSLTIFVFIYRSIEPESFAPSFRRYSVHIIYRILEAHRDSAVYNKLSPKPCRELDSKEERDRINNEGVLR